MDVIAVATVRVLYTYMYMYSKAYSTSTYRYTQLRVPVLCILYVQVAQVQYEYGNLTTSTHTCIQVRTAVRRTACYIQYNMYVPVHVRIPCLYSTSTRVPVLILPLVTQ